MTSFSDANDRQQRSVYLVLISSWLNTVMDAE